VTDQEDQPTAPSAEDVRTAERALAEAQAMKRIWKVLYPFPSVKRIRIVRAAAILLGLEDPARRA
jgi:hypothetical protein